LTEPKAELTTDFTEHSQQAIKASRNRRELTPADLAGKKGVEALDQIGKARNDWGAKKSAIVEANKDLTFEIKDAVDQWDKLLEDRLGVRVFGGKVYTVEDRLARKPSEMREILQINNKLTEAVQSNYVLNTKQMDDLKSAINDIVQAPKASQVKQINTVTEGLTKDFNKLIDDKLVKALGPDYQQANRNYGNLKKIETQLNKRLGEIIDPETGTARHGASLMKSAVQSNADRGTKALFEAVKKVTGHDLMQEALYAEIAMKAVKDPRMQSLLEASGAVTSALKGNTLGTLAKAGSYAKKKLTDDKIVKLVRFYNKAQNRSK
jgi:hypothetical protein